ncbi:MAG TPA: hypothetical protein VN736_00800 [Candidatus Limnocylindrales bacterium]|nr:hypothetical protein [Candidatus Limnocylindrales bacterium]
MPAYSGKFQYTGANGEDLGHGPCQVSFDAETAVVTPAGGLPVAFDLGDVDRTAPADWDLKLTLYTGASVTLQQFGAAFSDMSRELLAAWRDRTVRCLLLEDLEELGRFNGAANGGPGEIRIYKSNIAFLPQAGSPVQWRLAAVDSLAFDDASYSIALTRGSDRLVLSKVAKKTDEVLQKLREAHGALREQAARALHDVFPFLPPDALMRLQRMMPEGRSASLAALNEIHPKLADTLIERAVDEHLKPYFDVLRSRATKDPPMAGFKFIRPGDDEGEDPPEEGKMPLFFWFFFPLPNGTAAWEATTGTGRATYIFKAPGPIAETVETLTRGLALVNFRREPVYLSDDALDRQPRFHRYAIGARKLPELRALRQAYIGRAIHSSPEEWEKEIVEVGQS